jgi:chromosome segregation ATPase
LKYQKVAHVARLKCEEKQKGLSELQGRMDVLQKRLNEISEINQARKHEYQEVEKQFKAAEREYNKAKKALDVADAQYIQLNEELKRTNDSRKKNQKDAVKLEAEVEKLKGLPESHAADIEKLNTRKAELDEEVEQEGNNVKGDLAKLNIKVEAALKEKEAADKEFSKLKRQRDEKKSALDKLQKELNNYKEKETVEQNKLAQMETDLEKLKQTVQQKEKEGRSSLGHNKLAPMEGNLAQLQVYKQQLGGFENQKKNVFEQRRSEFLQAKDAMEGSRDIGQVSFVGILKDCRGR